MDFKELKNMTDEELKEIIPQFLKDRIYRIEEKEHVAEDIRNWMYDNYPEWSIDEADIVRAAEAFPYEHDSSLPYWNTIEKLIENCVLSKPKLTQKEIDQIRCDLSNAKEEKEDEPEDVSAEEHCRWTEETWDKFDNLPLEDVYSEDEEYTHGLVGYAIDNDYTVGDFYDLLSRIEEIINS